MYGEEEEGEGDKQKRWREYVGIKAEWFYIGIVISSLKKDTG